MMTGVERFQVVMEPYVPKDKLHALTMELMCIIVEEIVPIMKEELQFVADRLDQSITDCRAELEALRT